MSRLEFSRKVKAAAFLRSKGFCEVCGARLKPGEAEYDHVLPCALGGTAELSNCSVTCKPCHAEKTAADIRRTRKADRQRDKATGAYRAKQSIKSRGFPKQPKPEKLPMPEPRPMFERRETR